MDHFYFIRHGETVWNVENKICGATDIELTQRGHEQAIETGKRILEQGITADVILTSPLIRAKETARHISEITGIPMEVEPRLIEQNFGRYESTPRNGAEFHEAKKDMASRFETEKLSWWHITGLRGWWNPTSGKWITKSFHLAGSRIVR